MHKETTTSEAGRAKYISVWIFAVIMTAAVTAIPQLFAEIIFDELVLNIGLYGAYIVRYGAISVLDLIVILLVYACFRNVYIQRAMPYFWAIGVFWLIRVAGSWLGEVGLFYQRSGLLYIQIAIQFSSIFLIYWISSTFWPQKYYAPHIGHTKSTQHSLRTRNNAKLSEKVGPHVRREPPLSARKKDQFHE